MTNPKDKVRATMEEFKRGTLRSGAGPHVTDRKQAIAIALSQARKAGAQIPPPPGQAIGRALRNSVR